MRSNEYEACGISLVLFFCLVAGLYAAERIARILSLTIEDGIWICAIGSLIVGLVLIAISRRKQ